MKTDLDHPFDRSGLAILSDLGTPEWRELFSKLEKDQAEFLSLEDKFRSSEYRWPGDSLHEWSRIWEYPYAYHHLRRWRRTVPTETSPKVADVGSGVTFFPFSIGRLGCDVICTDIDPVCGVDLGRAAAVYAAAPGSVQFRLADGSSLPFADGELDAVYSISVIEHIPDFAHTLEEVWRILRPGGIFLLTCDMCMEGDLELGIESHGRLVRALHRHFDLTCPERTVHPKDTLYSDSAVRVDAAVQPRVFAWPNPLLAAWNHRYDIVVRPAESLKKGWANLVMARTRQRFAVSAFLTRRKG